MRHKKAVTGVAALLILFFHFYIPFTGSPIEVGIQKGAYVGVDLFFLVSAISLGSREKIPYGPFLWNRIKNVYLPFVIFALMAAVYKGWSTVRFLKVISFVEFFQKGGGAFAWFLPAIMLVYLIAPFLVWMRGKFTGWNAIWVMLGAWMLLGLILQYGLGYTELFIFLNRLPIFFIGLYYQSARTAVPETIRKSLRLAVLVSGILVLYRYGTVAKMMLPVKDFYYIMAIPFATAVAGYCDRGGTRFAWFDIPTRFVGAVSLELYCLQMIFGYDIEIYMMKLTGNNPCSFFIVAVLLILMAFVCHMVKTGVGVLYGKIVNVWHA